MANPPVRFAVDRIEGSEVVLESDRGTRVTVAVQDLPSTPREGMVYLVLLDDKRQPIWSSAVTDTAEEERRKQELGERMEKLKAHDDGKDIVL